MTGDNDYSHRESRRSFIKKGALGSGALALGLGATGSATANGEQDGRAAARDALMLKGELRPGALFRVVSPDLGQSTDVQALLGNNILDRYDVRRIEYLNTDEEVHFFPAGDAEVQQGEVYRFTQNITRSNDLPEPGVLDVTFEPFPEDITGEDNQLNPDDDFQLVDGGGDALVDISNFNPGALLLVTTDIIATAPRQGGLTVDTGEEYNSRLVEFLNTGEDFLVFPTDDATIEQGGVYLMRERDRTDTVAPNALVPITLDRVNKDDIPTPFV
jgi:hypothetical protein